MDMLVSGRVNHNPRKIFPIIMEVENGSPTKMIVSFRFFGNFPVNHDYWANLP